MKLLEAVRIVSIHESSAIHFEAVNFFSKYTTCPTETVRNNASVIVSLGSQDQ